MEKFLYQRDVDYMDIINALTEAFGPEKEEGDYFYFFEKCEDEHGLRDVTSYEEAEGTVINLYAMENMEMDLFKGEEA